MKKFCFNYNMVFGRILRIPDSSKCAGTRKRGVQSIYPQCHSSASAMTSYRRSRGTPDCTSKGTAFPLLSSHKSANLRYSPAALVPYRQLVPGISVYSLLSCVCKLYTCKSTQTKSKLPKAPEFLKNFIIFSKRKLNSFFKYH